MTINPGVKGGFLSRRVPIPIYNISKWVIFGQGYPRGVLQPEQVTFTAVRTSILCHKRV